ncbi:unnamed protein product [Closterium sp. NIES-53]
MPRRCGGGGTSGSGTRARRVGSGGGHRQQQQRRSETKSPKKLREWFLRGASRSCGPYVIRTGDRAGQTCGRLHTQHRCFSRLDDAWCAEFGGDVELPHWADLLRSRIAIFDLDFDAILSAMYALSSGTLPGTAPTQALHTFTLDSGASACFFRDSTTLTPLSTLVLVRLADPSEGPVMAHSSIVLPCLAVPSGSLSGLHLPLFSANLVSTAALQDAMVTTTTPGGQRVTICTCTRTGRHLATFTHRPGSSLYTLATEPPQTRLWHHRLGHPSLPRLRGMHSCLLVSGLFRSLPPLPPLPAPPCLPCVEGRQRAAPHSSSFPPMTAPLQTLHMDVWGPARVSGQSHKRYFMLAVDDYMRDFCRGEGILQSFTLLDSPQQNGIAKRRIGLVMEVARTSIIHAAAPHFLWPFAVRYAAHQLNLWPRVSLSETSPTLHWMGKVGDAGGRFRVWESRAFVCDTSTDKLSPRAIPCVFLGFVPDALGWQFYHPTWRCVFPSQDVMFDELIPFYHPLPGPALVEVAVGSGASRGSASGGAGPWGDASGGAGPGGAESEGAETRGAEPGGVEPGGGEPGGTEPEGVEPGGAASEGTASEGAESGGAEPQGAASSRGSPAEGAGVADGAGVPGGTAVTGPGGARTRGIGAAGTGGVEGGGARDPTKSGATDVGGSGAGSAGAGGAGVGGTGAGGAGVGGPGVGGAGAGGAGASQPQLQPASPLPAPSPYTEQIGGLIEHREPASRPVSPVRTARRVPRTRPPPLPGTHAMTLRPSSVPLRVPLPAPPESSLCEVLGPESDHVRAASPTFSCLLATAVTDPFFEAAAASALVAELLDFAVACRLDYATALVAESESASPPSIGDIPTPRSYAEAITGPYSSQWQAAMDAEMASRKSIGTFVDEDPPPGANIVDGMWIFRGVDYFQTFSPTLKMTTLRLLLHVPAQRDYELHSLDFTSGGQSTVSARHDTLRTTPATHGFAPATTDPSLFLHTDTSLPPFYVLLYVDDLVFAAADTEALALVKSELQKRHTCTDLSPSALRFQFSSPQPTPLSTSHSLSTPPSDESVEPSGPYPELVGCLITLGLGLVLGGRGLVVLTGHADTSWVDDSATQRSSSCEAEIYARAMAAQELCWLTYLLTDLGEQPRSPPVLYVDNKAMIALCQEHRLEHQMKHIALRYFLARELQQRGLLRLAYVATWANTADIFTKELLFCVRPSCFAFLDWSCDHLFSPTLPMGLCQNIIAFTFM